MKKNISFYRTQINNIDKEIINLLNKRIENAKQIGEIKKTKNLPVFNEKREKEIYNKINKLNKNFPEPFLNKIYSNIMAASRFVERKLKIIYLGPEGSFTNIAAKSKFPESDLIFANSIPSVFHKVENNDGDYGIVPIENSNNGIVTYTLDKLLTTSLNIVSEIVTKISHNLISKEKDINKIKNIYSHPQSFGQCENWISNNFNDDIKLIPVESNSKAAELAAQKKNSAAISSLLAAKIYKLNIIEEEIEDYKNNSTRFYVIGKDKPKKSKTNKTALAFAAKDKIGILFKCLEPFAKNNINLTNIESRPVKRQPWQYVFFVDFIGYINDKNVKNTLTELDKYCSFIKILGSYPI